MRARSTSGTMVFHATEWSSVPGLLSGIDPAAGRVNLDFSRQPAFYVGSDWDDALQEDFHNARLRFNSEACIVLYRVEDEVLQALAPNDSLGNEWSAEWQQLIRWCRTRRLDRASLLAYAGSKFARDHWISGRQWSVDDAALLNDTKLQMRPYEQLCVRSPQAAALFDAGLVGVVFLGFGVVSGGVRDIMSEAEFNEWRQVARHTQVRT